VVEEKSPVYAIINHEHNEDVVVIILDTKEDSEAIALELQRRGRRVHVEPASEFTSS
jgi:hypothetical protein